MRRAGMGEVSLEKSPRVWGLLVEEWARTKPWIRGQAWPLCFVALLTAEDLQI